MLPAPRSRRAAAANGTARIEPRKRGEVVTGEWDYKDESGELAFVVERFEYQNADGNYVIKDGKPKKTFRQRRPDPDGQADGFGTSRA